MDAVRKLVSKKKRRFVTREGNFDLDLSYITPRIIAMGFPSENLEGVFRNPMSEVVRFLETKHANHYKVYNLCSERTYDPAKFQGRVACYPFDDHNAPPLDMIKPFCEDVDAFLKADKDNVAVVHCKAGKGRTGVLICAYLLHCRMWSTPDDAMKFYGMARTENAKGVTIPSQQRYVYYYAEMLTKHLEYKERTIFLKKIILHTVPRISNNTCAPFFVVTKGHIKVFQSAVTENVSRDQTFIEIQPKNIQPLCGDIKIEFFHKDKFKTPAKMFHFWFNTFMVKNDELFLKKSELDKANKDKKHAVYDANFVVEVQFAALDESGEEKPGRSRSSLLVTKDVASAIAEVANKTDPKAGAEQRMMEDRETDEEDLSDDEDDDDDDNSNPHAAGSVQMA